LVGYNLLKVDVPLLMFKSISNNLTDEFFEKMNQCNIVDLHAILTFLNQGKIEQGGLKGWCKNFRIPYNPPISGNEISQVMLDRNYKLMERYIDEEVKAIAELNKRLFDRDKLSEALSIFTHKS
jgi:hypothetical protein